MLLLYLCQEGHAHQIGQGGADHAQPAVPHPVGAGHAHLVNEVSAVQFLRNLFDLCIWILRLHHRKRGSTPCSGLPAGGAGQAHWCQQER